MMFKVEDLEIITHLLLSRLKDTMADRIELKNDYYWYITANELNNVYVEPSNIVIGQLSEDLNELQDLLDNPNEALPFHLTKLAAILRGLGDELVTFKDPNSI